MMDIKSFFLLIFLSAAQGVIGNESDEDNIARGKNALVGGHSINWLTDGSMACFSVEATEDVVIELENLYNVQEVILFGKENFLAKNIEISIADQYLPRLEPQYVPCSNDTDLGSGSRYVCSKKGNLVMVRTLGGNDRSFELCEIKVFGVIEVSIIFNKSMLKQNLELRNSLMEGISSISLPYAPMQVLVVRKKATPLFVKPSTRECVLAASTVGEGRVIVSGERGFLDKILHDKSTIWSRLKNWLAKGAKPYLVSASNVRSSTQFSNKGGIILWTQYYEVSNSSKALILELLKSGKVGVITGDRQNNVEPIYGPYQEILDEAGVVLVNRYGNYDPTDWTTSGFEDFQLVSVEQQMEYALAETEYFFKYPSLLEDLNLIPPKMLDMSIDKSKLLRLLDAIEPYMKTISPSDQRKTKTAIEKEYNTAFAKLMTSRVLANVSRAAPNVDIFPGLPAANATEETVKITFVSSFDNEMHSTGLYLAPGRTLKIKVLSLETKATSWYVRVGCHSDDVGKRPEWARYRTVATPDIPVLFGEVFSGFGGTILIKNVLKYYMDPTGRAEITLEFSGVIRAPYFNLRDEKNIQEWDTKGRYYPAPWAEIASDKLIFSVPSDSVRNYDKNYLTDLMTNVWDLAVKGNFWLVFGQWKERRRERLTVDMQTSSGYGHSGYSIMAHLAWLPGMLGDINIEKDERWGVSHELGHNLQDARWTFDGTGEVTCNIFACFDRYLWDKDFFSVNVKDSQIKNAIRHLNDGARYESWISDPYLTLELYRQIAYHFGFEVYRNAFKRYTEDVQPKTNQEKMDVWLEFVSKSANRNLCPLFEFWGYTISSGTETALQKTYNNTAFFPDDDRTQLSPTRTEYILEKYSRYHIDRNSPIGIESGDYRENVKRFTETLLPNDVIYR